MRDLKDWAIVQAHGLTLIGKPDGIILSPVYELKSALVPPRADHMVMAAPLWLFTSITKITMPDGALVVSVTDLDDAEQRMISNAIDGAEKMIQQMRAKKSGISLGKM